MRINKSIWCLFLIAITCQNCVSYQRYALPKDRIRVVENKSMSFYMLDKAHPLTRVWYLSDYQFKENSLHCFAVKMAEIEAKEIYKISNRADSKYSKDDVLFFVDPKYAMALRDTCTINIPFSQLEQVEVYEVNYTKTIGNAILVALGIVLIGSILG